jgi:hypothetical protein
MRRSPGVLVFWNLDLGPGTLDYDEVTARPRRG